ncbi:MAG: tetratricopeptide repeat protein [Elusimicrobia bacterium]|nr:tetratricopeptide repeat protein [Elusimicrobiota bacterium]
MDDGRGREHWVRRGIEDYNAGRHAQALRCFRRALSTGESRPDIRCFEANALRSMGRRREAIDAFLAAVRDSPRCLPAYSGLAQVMRQGGRSARAARTLRGILALEPRTRADRGRLVEALRDCGKAFEAAGRLDLAAIALRRAVGFGLDEPAALAEFAEFLARVGLNSGSLARLATAEKTLRRALRAEPGRGGTRALLLGVLRQRASLQSGAGRLGAAEDALRQALREEPGHAATIRQLGALRRRRASLQLSAGRLEEAESTLRAVLACAPDDADARRQLAETLRERGLVLLSRDRLEAAAAALDAALALAAGDRRSRPFMAGVLRILGQAYRSRGQWAKAQAALHRVLKLDPNDGWARLHLGEILYSSGRAKAAKALLRKAVAGDRGALDGPDKFKALVKMGLYAQAAQAAEAAIDAGLSVADLRAFLDPWEWDHRHSAHDRRRELRQLARSIGSRRLGPWLQYFRALLSGPDGAARFEAVARAPRRRYGWMLYKAASATLLAGNFKRAVSWSKLALRQRPLDWRAHGFLAEAYLCLQNPRAARAQMRRALSAASADEKGHALTWSGAVDLWLGRYADALRHLEKACALGAPFAYCCGGDSQARTPAQGRAAPRRRPAALPEGFRGLRLARRGQAGTGPLRRGPRGPRRQPSPFDLDLHQPRSGQEGTPGRGRNEGRFRSRSGIRHPAFEKEGRIGRARAAGRSGDGRPAGGRFEVGPRVQAARIRSGLLDLEPAKKSRPSMAKRNLIREDAAQMHERQQRRGRPKTCAPIAAFAPAPVRRSDLQEP